MTKQLVTPDLGDFNNVPVVEIYVSEGDRVNKDDLLMAIESDKATMELPASEGGKITRLLVAVGNRISTGQPLLELEPDAEIFEADTGAATADRTVTPVPPSAAESEEPNPSGINGGLHSQLVVLGAGPGGYTAAFRAADLGLDVTLIEKFPTLGGVCLNVGCIPSKALLHAAKIINESAEASRIGINYPSPDINITKTLAWKNSIIKQLTGGLSVLAKKRKVHIIQAEGKFSSENTLILDSGVTVSFDQAIIAAGSRPIQIPGFSHDDPRVIDSTGALELTDIPKDLLIIGGGIIGLEMANVFHAFGSRIHIVEMLGDLIAGADPDMVRPLKKRISRQYENIWLQTRVTDMKARETGIQVSFEGKNAPSEMLFDKVLVCVGRTPNGAKIGAERAGIMIDGRGFINVDDQQRTNVPHIFAIGDIVGQPMLAHKAVHEGRVAAEVAAKMKSGFDARVIPSVAYTDPEIAWVGVTESEAKEKGIDYGKGTFPWAASGRSLSQGRNDGITKLLFDKNSGAIIGAGITGNNAGDLIAEATLAIEMNADAEDISLAIHPHPTLAETLGFAAEAFNGTITDLYMPKK